MLRVTFRGLWARKVRLLLSAIAVVLGVAMVSGTYVLTDTIGSAFENLFASVNRNTAVAVRGTTGAGFSNTDANADRSPLPASLLPKVQAVPGVREAEPERLRHRADHQPGDQQAGVERWCARARGQLLGLPAGDADLAPRHGPARASRSPSTAARSTRSI